MDNIFVKDFNKTMLERRALYSCNLKDLPLPDLKRELDVLGFRNLYYIKSKDNYFSKFTHPVVVLKDKSFTRKVVLQNGKPLLDAKRVPVVKQVKVDKDCVVVASLEDVGLKLGALVKGMGLLGKKEMQGSMIYFYSVNKSLLFRANLVAFYFSRIKLRAFYKGLKIALQTGDFIYAYIAPFNINDSYKDKATLTRTLINVKTSLDFDEDLLKVLDHWYQFGLVFDPHIASLDIPIKEVINVAYQELDSTLDEINFMSMSSVSLSEEKEKSVLEDGLDG